MTHPPLLQPKKTWSRSWVVCWALLAGFVASPVVALAQPVTEIRPNALIAQVQDSTAAERITVVTGQALLLRLKQDVFRASIANPSLIEVVQFSPSELQIIGTREGTTTLSLWYGDPQQVVTYVVQVRPDETQPGDLTLRVRVARLEKIVNELFPNSKVSLIPVYDKILVRGQAVDEVEKDRILALIQGNTINQNGDVTAIAGAYGDPTRPVDALTRMQQAAPAPVGGRRVAGPGGAVNFDYQDDAIPLDIPANDVIDMLRVPGEKQVLLKVRIAEISRTATRGIRSDFNVNVGDFAYRHIFGAGLFGVGGGAGVGLGGGAGGLNGGLAGGLFGNGVGGGQAVSIYNGDDVQIGISALMSNGTGKILAAPNLVTENGVSASFIAGGEFAVPTIVGINGAQAVSTNFRGFGTQLTFTPYILDKDRIRLKVNPSFSTVNQSLNVQGVPGVNNRAVTTQVVLREGQWLALAGLIEDTQIGSNTRLPILGDIPVVKILFSQTAVERGETELLVLTSPELIHPLEAEQVPPLLPGMDVTEPTDVDLFLGQRWEGRPGVHHRSTMWPIYQQRVLDAQRKAHRTAKEIRKSQKYYVTGSHGFCN